MPTPPRRRPPLRLALAPGDAAAETARELARQLAEIDSAITAVRRADQNLPAIVTATARLAGQVATLAGRLARQLDQVRETADATMTADGAARRRLDAIEARLAAIEAASDRQARATLARAGIAPAIRRRAAS